MRLLAEMPESPDRAQALYVASSSYFQLGDAEKGEFKSRWRRNMRVLLETQIWFEIDQKILPPEQ